MQNLKAEILAPAGSMESLVAAVRCGANAVYLGSTELNARAGAQNFDKTLLEKAVSYCHARGVKVHLAINTIVFENELETAQATIRDGAQAGVDAFIIQDLAVLELAKNSAPDIELHASTQMAVHNIEGVKILEEMGFHRVVLARELSLGEISQITNNTKLKVECFVHGALCMSMSGQCYLSSMIGGRSGNRGRCAQPCRLPFKSEGSDSALSLKDMSVIEYIPQLHEVGVHSFKIEGRLKHPQYVAATVTACRQVIAGETPDYDLLQSVFSRSGFTDGYITGELGNDMFGTRTKEDKSATQGVLKSLEQLYRNENPLVGVDFSLTIKEGQPVTIKAAANQAQVLITGDIPQIALTAPTTYEKLEQAFGKTGGTPFYLRELNCDIDSHLMLPVSVLNAYRRQALDDLLAQLEAPAPKPYYEYKIPTNIREVLEEKPAIIVRLSSKKQLDDKLLASVSRIILPIEEGVKLESIAEKVILELPDFIFSKAAMDKLKSQLEIGKAKGFTQAMAGSLFGIELAKSYGFNCHGGYLLNVVNSLSLKFYENLGLQSVTMSLEYPVGTAVSSVNRGVIIYGNPPLMTFRNTPAQLKEGAGYLTDRLGKRFRVENHGEFSTLYNTVPIYTGENAAKFREFSFYILYYTTETLQEVLEITNNILAGNPMDIAHTKGLYYGKVI